MNTKKEFGIGLLRYLISHWNLEFKLPSGIHMLVPSQAPEDADPEITYAVLITCESDGYSVSTPKIITLLSL